MRGGARATTTSHRPPCCAPQEFGVKYTTGTFVQIYKEMVQSFRHPHSLAKEIMVYGAL